MKTMKNFAAQQLSKTQMNEVKGGAATFACGTGNGMLGIYTFQTSLEMADFLSSNGGGKCNFLYSI